MQCNMPCRATKNTAKKGCETLCRLPQANRGSRGEHPTSQPPWAATRPTTGHMPPPRQPSGRAGPHAPYPIVAVCLHAPYPIVAACPLRMAGIAPVSGEFGAILWNGYGIQGENYVSLLQGSEMSAEFHYRDLILYICYGFIALGVYYGAGG